MDSEVLDLVVLGHVEDLRLVDHLVEPELREFGHGEPKRPGVHRRW